ncbi:hypothetical protein D3C80_841980 [compost metagenome]
MAADHAVVVKAAHVHGLVGHGRGQQQTVIGGAQVNLAQCCCGLALRCTVWSGGALAGGQQAIVDVQVQTTLGVQQRVAQDIRRRSVVAGHPAIALNRGCVLRVVVASLEAGIERLLLQRQHAHFGRSFSQQAQVFLVGGWRTGGEVETQRVAAAADVFGVAREVGQQGVVDYSVADPDAQYLPGDGA